MDINSLFPAQSVAPINIPLQMPAPKKKGGMFGSGSNIGMAISAALNGFLAARGNQVGALNLQQMYARLNEQKQAEAQEAQYQRQRQDQMQDWVAKQMFERNNPSPRAPHYFESNSGDQYMIGPDGQPQIVFKDPFRYKMVPNGMGGVVPVDIEQLMRGGQAPQITEDEWNKGQPIGGPTASPSGGFRSPF